MLWGPLSEKNKKTKNKNPLYVGVGGGARGKRLILSCLRVEKNSTKEKIEAEKGKARRPTRLQHCAPRETYSTLQCGSFVCSSQAGCARTLSYCGIGRAPRCRWKVRMARRTRAATILMMKQNVQSSHITWPWSITRYGASRGVASSQSLSAAPKGHASAALPRLPLCFVPCLALYRVLGCLMCGKRPK